jgi:hypothetical protein
MCPSKSLDGWRNNDLTGRLSMSLNSAIKSDTYGNKEVLDFEGEPVLRSWQYFECSSEQVGVAFGWTRMEDDIAQLFSGKFPYQPSGSIFLSASAKLRGCVADASTFSSGMGKQLRSQSRSAPAMTRYSLHNWGGLLRHQKCGRCIFPIKVMFPDDFGLAPSEARRKRARRWFSDSVA